MQVQTPSYYDSHGQSQSQTPGHAPHGMTNGIALAGVGNPMMARQMSMGSNMGPIGLNTGPIGSNMGPSMGSGMGPNMGSGMGPGMGSGMGSGMGPGMGSGIGMGMDYGGGHMAGSLEDVRRRTRSQQEVHMMEMGW